MKITSLSPWKICKGAVCAWAVFTGVFLLHSAGENKEGFVAHEWGTFTSLQGSDGKLLSWRPLETAELPKFVYDWKHPGDDRVANFMSGDFGKGSLVTLQRMETPVIYFYTKQSQDVDVTVKFPSGHITEWYPQARDIGPSRRRDFSAAFSMIARPSAAMTAMVTNNDSLIRWSGQILPNPDKALDQQLPTDPSGRHYFTARETDAALVRVSASNTPELEKFLFYRGVGNFETALRVTVANEVVTIENTGKEDLKHLILLNVHDRQGNFASIEKLAPSEKKTISLDGVATTLPIEKTAKTVSEAMAKSLEGEGLYKREATAMVKTWDKSWFEEEGMRVLYVLPRAWTDQTLPMSLQPQPRELVRVMVGRAEIIPPSLEKSLVEQLTKAKQGDTAAKENAQALLKQHGRFAEPIFNRAAAQVATKPGTVNLSQLYLESVRRN